MLDSLFGEDFNIELNNKTKVKSLVKKATAKRENVLEADPEKILKSKRSH